MQHAGGKWHRSPRYSVYLCSTLKDHKDELYCIKCQKWIAGGGFSHTIQHGEGHAGRGNSTTGSSAGTKLLKVNQRVSLTQRKHRRGLLRNSLTSSSAMLVQLTGGEGF